MDSLFRFPTRLVFGSGSLDGLAAEATRVAQAPCTVMLVCGSGYTAGSEGFARVGTMLKSAGYRVETFAEVTADPPVELVERCAGRLLSTGAALAVAYGGGSPIDCAKAAIVLAANSGPEGPHPGASYLEYLYGRLSLERPGIPLIAIPTTAGTGSETSSAAVVTDTGAKSKRGLSSDFFFPKSAIVDPRLQDSMPPALAAATGMDALTHAVESYVSRASTPLTRAIAGESARLIVSSLENSARGETQARSDMAYASSIAGIAFSQTGLGMVHGFAHPIGARCGLPHGMANAIMLPHVCRACSLESQVPYAALARLCGLADEQTPVGEAAGALVREFSRLASALGIPGNLRRAGVERERLTEILADALTYRARPNSPKQFSDAELSALLESSW